MTVSSTTSRADATGNGVTTAFTANFRILAETHIMVLRTQISTGVVTTLALTTDYTVSGVGGSSFTVTCLVAPTADQRLSILRNVPLTQLTDYVENDPFPAQSHEDALDKLTMEVQQLNEVLDRALTLSPNSIGVSVELPEPEAFALIGWNATGDELQNFAGTSDIPISSVMEPVVTAATLAEARDELGVEIGVDVVGAGAVTTSGLTMATSRLLGRTTASAGAVEEISVSGALTLTGGALSTALLRGYIDGLTLSTAGSSATMTIAAGQAADSTNARYMTLAAAIAKTTSAWAVGTGNGGKLSAAAIANNTWYYFYEIERSDTGVVDVGFDVSPTTPTMPTNYTHSRYIGAGLTNGSAQWVKFIQVGDEYKWDTPVLDVTTAASGTSAVTAALSLPRGRKMEAILNVFAQGTNYVSDLDTADLAGSATVAPLVSAPQANGAQVRVRTDTSAQIRYRNGVNGYFYITTLGWIDNRGKNA